MVEPETPADVPTADLTPEKAPPARWGTVALVAVGVLTLLGGVAALVIGRLGGSSPSQSVSPSHSPRYITCAYAGTLGGAGVDRGYCDRFAEDVVRRTDLTQEQRDRLEGDADKAQRAVRVPAFCADVLRQAPSGRFPECAGLPTSPVRNRALPGGSAPAAPGDSQPRPADAEAIRLALERAGFPGATVRVAREDDLHRTAPSSSACQSPRPAWSGTRRCPAVAAGTAFRANCPTAAVCPPNCAEAEPSNHMAPSVPQN